MQCENEFCIYWARGACRLDSISLDVQGKCTCCTYVDIDEAILRPYRQP